MSDPIFSPGEYYCDLRFGMSRVDAETSDGQPTDVFDDLAIFPEDKAAAKGVVEYVYDGFRPFHEKEVSLTFFNDGLVRIH